MCVEFLEYPLFVCVFVVCVCVCVCMCVYVCVLGCNFFKVIQNNFYLFLHGV